ncbi:hypothetical protein HK096_007251, partial [Nowakowskiella sp. JEL0078]
MSEQSLLEKTQEASPLSLPVQSSAPLPLKPNVFLPPMIIPDTRISSVAQNFTLAKANPSVSNPMSSSQPPIQSISQFSQHGPQSDQSKSSPHFRHFSNQTVPSGSSPTAYANQHVFPVQSQQQQIQYNPVFNQREDYTEPIQPQNIPNSEKRKMQIEEKKEVDEDVLNEYKTLKDRYRYICRENETLKEEYQRLKVRVKKLKLEKNALLENLMQKEG